LNEKYKGAKIGLKMINPAPKPSVRRLSSSNLSQSNDDEMFRQVLADHEARQNELLGENQKLRDLLYEMQTKLTEFLQTQTQMTPKRTMDIDPEFLGIETPESYNPQAAKFHLPFGMFGQNLEEEVDQLLETLKHEWNNRPAGMVVELEEKENEIDKRDLVIQQKDREIRDKNIEIQRKDAEINQQMSELNKKEMEIQQRIMEIERKQEEIQQQQIEIDVLKEELEGAKDYAKKAHDLLEDQIENNFHEGLPDHSIDETTIPEYDEENRDLIKKREQLNTERKKFTEQLIRLGKDREMLLQERVEFEIEKRNWKAAHPTPGRSLVIPLGDQTIFGKYTPVRAQNQTTRYFISKDSPLTPFLERYQRELTTQH
ncbi:1159_t:CDS:2, partial [Ambispora leptoticha]